MALSAPKALTLLQATQLLLEEKALPTQPLLLTRARSKDALWREVINASTGTNRTNRTRLAAAQALLIRKTANHHEEPINEGMPPGKTRQLKRRRTVRAPLMNGTTNATQIRRLNPTNPTPPRTNHGLPTPGGPA
jgi:hypothetical protein